LATGNAMESDASQRGPSAEASLRLSLARTAGLYFIFALGAIHLSRQPGSIATLWYANAVAVAVLQARRSAEWPAHFVVVACANIAANLAYGDPLGLTLAFIPGNLFEILVASHLLRRCCTPARSIGHVGALLSALLVGGIAPSLLGALLGAATLAFYGLASFSEVWFSWFVSGAVGSVSILPLGLLLVARGWRPVVAVLRRWSVAAALLAAVAIALSAPTTQAFPYVYVSVALMLVAAVGGFGAAAVGGMLCSVSVGALTALGSFLPLRDGGSLGLVVFYLPLILTLVPPLLLAAALDRNRQHLAEIADREAQFRTLYERTPVMMHSVDVERRLVAVNDAWLARLGYERSEVLGRRSTEFLTAESRERAERSIIPRFMREGELRDMDYQMVTKSGEVLDVLLSAIWETDADGQLLRTLAVLKDVTEQKRLALELAAEKERIEVTLHSIGDGVVSTDEAGRVTYLNPVAEQMVGCLLAQARGLPFAQVVHLFDQESGAPLPSPVEQCLQDREVYGVRESAALRHRSGRDYGVQISAAPIAGRDGRVLGAVMVFQDVTEARGLAQKMSYLAHHDGLTGLPNRVLFQDRVHQACQSARRHDRRFAVVFMDLDHFKHVNDSLGHAVGDELLKAVAQRLTGTLRASDTICRLGGDEFVVLLSELDDVDVDGVAEVAKKILRQVAQPCVLGGTEVNVGASLGIALFPGDGEDPDTLMKRADAAMYRSKREGRNRYHFFSKAVDEAASARLQLEADMRRALAAGQFIVHYQPVVDGRTRDAVAVEALVRWDRAGQGLQSPAVFIPVAEESGLIVPLGHWILRQACAQLKAWSGTALGGISIAVNVSPVQLAQADFVDTVAEVLHASGVDGSRIEFEITESTLMQDPEATLEMLRRLKALGVRIAIDDFGTGYSSLGHLKRFPVDTLKIDRTFVRDLETDADDRELVRAILAMARSLRLHVVAEGVETEAQAAILASMECPAFQGFLFARPADAAATAAWLQARAATLAL
jgi:diguanylate cyclase (GGDEF)-like protein/PAS domain S-box-containing protein